MDNRVIRPVTTGGLIDTRIKKGNNTDSQKKDFSQVLDKVLSNDNEIKFSKHAKERIDQREVVLTKSEVEDVKNAISLAKEKGIRDSLILSKNCAYVVNIESSTVVTVIDKENIKEKVFTNIDGAVSI